MCCTVLRSTLPRPMPASLHKTRPQQKSLKYIICLFFLNKNIIFRHSILQQTVTWIFYFLKPSVTYQTMIHYKIIIKFQQMSIACYQFQITSCINHNIPYVSLTQPKSFLQLDCMHYLCLVLYIYKPWHFRSYFYFHLLVNGKTENPNHDPKMKKVWPKAQQSRVFTSNWSPEGRYRTNFQKVVVLIQKELLDDGLNPTK